MLTRRIVMSACALCIAARPPPAHRRPRTRPAGRPVRHHRHHLSEARQGQGALRHDPRHLSGPRQGQGPYGTTTATYPDLVKAKGPYGTTTATYPNLVEAKGPYGTTVAASTQRTTGATATPPAPRPATASNDWRTAAISEAALLAALALGSAWLLSARRHAPRLGM